MPQAPSLPHTPSSLRHSTSSDHLAAGRSQPSPAASETGNLPGGTPVRARTMPLSDLLSPGTYSGIHHPVPGQRSRLGSPDFRVAFDGSGYEEAFKASPALEHLEKYPAVQPLLQSLEALVESEAKATTATEKDSIKSEKGELIERTWATQHALGARRRMNLNHNVAPILPAGATYRAPDQIEIKPSHPDYANRTLSHRFLRLRTTVQTFLAEAGLSSQPEDWSAFTSEDLEKAFRGAPNYYVHGWEPEFPIEDPDSPLGCEQHDRQVRDEWKNGGFDRERGATFISLNDGREWIVWLNDRTAGYNLGTGVALAGSPSEVYRALEKDRPEALRGLDKLFVAPPTVSYALHALQNIAPEKAHRLLAAHCNARADFVTDMGFDEFGRVVQNHYPDVVVARYDRQTTDLQTLGAVLDAFEGRLFLVKLFKDGAVALQDKFSLCIDGPGLTPSLNRERTKSVKEDDKDAPRSGTPWFRQFNWTSQQYLDSRRNNLLSDAPDDVRISAPPNTMPRRIPRANDSRLYNPADYSGKSLKYKTPSAILQQHFDNCDQIGIISTGALRAAVAPDEAGLARLAEEWQTGFLATCLPYAGIKVESPADLARPVYQTHGIWPEISACLIKRCVESRNDALPPHKKVKVSLDVRGSAADLPNLGEDPAGYMLQFRQGGRLSNVLFYKSQGIAVFRGVFGYTYPASELSNVAQREGWWNEGPVSLLHFEGEDVSPLIEVEEPRQESAEEGGAEEDRKRKRPSSISSNTSSGSDLALRPKPRKAGRLEQDTGPEPEASPR